MSQQFKRIQVKHIILFFILFIGLVLRFYKLDSLMSFVSDQGWFYWSAKEFIVDGNVPLVGIASSHVWLHQGAIWTYILSLLFIISNFNPVSPAYFIAVLGLLTIFLIYYVLREMFSMNTALIGSFLYATSPLVIINDRFAYHTSLIPAAAIVFVYLVYKVIKGNKEFIPLIFFFIGLLYNLEIAAFSLIATFLFILLFGIFNKHKWALEFLKTKQILNSVLAFIVPMTPMIIYDFSHGFPQTLKFIAWVAYRFLHIFGLSIHSEVGGNTSDFFIFSIRSIQNLFFLPSVEVSLLIFISVLFISFYKFFRFISDNNYQINFFIIFLFTLIPTLFFIVQKTGSDAYLPMLYPFWIILAAIILGSLNKKLNFNIIFLIFLIFSLNLVFLFNNNFYSANKLNDKIKIVKKIINLSQGRPYNILGRGEGSQYESFVTPYKFIAFWLGNPASEKDVSLKFYVSEDSDKILINR